MQFWRSRNGTWNQYTETLKESPNAPGPRTFWGHYVNEVVPLLSSLLLLRTDRNRERDELVYAGIRSPLARGLLYQHGSDEVRELITPAVRDAEENAMSEFYACIRENRQPAADIKVAAVAALTTIMGREAIYQRRMMTWKELGVTV